MRIVVTHGGNARANVLQTAQGDIDQGGLTHLEPAFPAQEGLQSLGVTVAHSEDVIQNLGTVLKKVKVIADATAKAVGVLAKVRAQFQHYNHFDVDRLLRFILTPTLLGWCSTQCARYVGHCLLTPH